MKIGILGSGSVAQTLGEGLLRHGHGVMLGSSSPDKLGAWVQAHPGAAADSFGDAAAFADLVILAVKGQAASAVVAAAGAATLAGKTVIDACNPIADAPPVEGVLLSFLGPNDSLLEHLQKGFPGVHFVKAFNSVGAAHMIDPRFAGGPPTMFIAGDDAAAKVAVTALLTEVGWEAADMGTAVAARAIEPLSTLWCIPGFRQNEWAHAFKLLKTG